MASIAQAAGRLAWRQTIAGDLLSGYATDALPAFMLLRTTWIPPDR